MKRSDLSPAIGWQTRLLNPDLWPPVAKTFALGILVGVLAAVVTLAATDGSGITPPDAIFTVVGVLSVLVWKRDTVAG